MTTNYENVTVTFTGDEFKLFKSLAYRFYSMLLVTSSIYDKFYDDLKNVDIDVVASLNVLRDLVDDNISSNNEIVNFLRQLKDM